MSQTRAIYLGGDVTMDFVLISAGSFSMGSDSNNSEQPIHTVNITQDFYMGKYEVTQAQWQRLMSSNPSHFTGDLSRPVEQVSWDDCQNFVFIVNALKHGTVRLPTEAEWEYACRAGSTTEHYWGNAPSEDYCWCKGNSGSTTHPVGKKKANSWGLHDMIGNVWEWCNDWYGAYPSETVSDPAGPATGSYRVYRGGSWYFSITRGLSTYRCHSGPSGVGSGLGLRLVLLA
jgi:formylglycine-generating enzyme required for sulfatase activity